MIRDPEASKTEPPEGWSAVLAQTEPPEGYWSAVLAQGETPGRCTESSHSGWPDPVVGHAPAARNGSPHVSAEAEDAHWAELAEWRDLGRPIEAPVIGCNKGGLLVRVCTGIGFVPASQLVDLPAGLGTPALRDQLQCFVGRVLTLRLIELDRERSRVICSERAVNIRDDHVAARLATLGQLVGEVVPGKVRSVCDFGVFVDLNGVDGLIHISELSWQRISHPSDVVGPDDELDVVVLSVDSAARRVALSRKRLSPDPWDAVGGLYGVGDVVDAVVTNVVDFGAFARVPEGVDGLIHISELSDGPFMHPGDVVTAGQAVRVRVLHIDGEARRLGLSLRQTG
jgi:small subunit ribosomal protein S1